MQRPKYDHCPLFPILRPVLDKFSQHAAEDLVSNARLFAYFCEMGCFILLPLGFLGVYVMAQKTKAEHSAFWALLLGWIGAGVTLPGFGAETFALRAIGLNSAPFGWAFIFLVMGLGLIGVAAFSWMSQFEKWTICPH